ncbi:putative U6 snRNA-associated Sm-like protein LSm4 [Porphyridium purpureum]|uniref:U6 snRNA-associated Sm-like protein LSm4 n=1 Tax=Porphyridium purpureum TaxID=35688 RepID=A0A5J4YI67_PORPP|nr:putative U6 snRNA-associated Sm-like protein LSm4 [Porphyridium purpureum]KAA8492288.1 putative U6 snRNA-associated Sm-like protein LSm4 [Porphyridium purpureum]|eukprot:POR9015..scf250_33
MLPLSLMRAAVGQPIMVEMKSGETYNGVLLAVDAYMNMTLGDPQLLAEQQVATRGAQEKSEDAAESSKDLSREQPGQEGAERLSAAIEPDRSRRVICASKDADKFVSAREVYIRGNTIKYVRMDDSMVEVVKETFAKQQQQRAAANLSSENQYGQPRSNQPQRGGFRGGRGTGGWRGSPSSRGAGAGSGSYRGRGGGSGRMDAAAVSVVPQHDRS